MKPFLLSAVLSATLFSLPADAQSPPTVAPPAPPTVLAPPLAVGAPTPAAPVGIHLDLPPFEEATPPLFWANAEYLLWWIRSAPVSAPLVTTTSSSAPDPLATTIGDPSTVVLAGNRNVNYDPLSGARFTVGATLGTSVGLESSTFFLAQTVKTQNFATDNNGNPPLSLPFFDLFTGGQNVYGVSSPGAGTGSISVASAARLWGTELNAIGNVSSNPRRKLDLIAGFRYLDLSEQLTVTSTSVTLGENFDEFTRDQFKTANYFYGPQIGVRGEGRWYNLGFRGEAKVALGDNQEIVDIAGFSATNQSPTPVAGGVYAVPSNSGHFSHDRFAVVPELNLQLSYYLGTNLRAFVGYDFLYVSTVVRAGNQVNTAINGSQQPLNFFDFGPGGIPGPIPPSRQSDFWAQGLTFGIDFRY